MYQLTLNVLRHDRETCTFRPLPRPVGKLSLNVCTPCEYCSRLLPASNRLLSKSGPRPAPKDWEYTPSQNGSSQSAALAQARKRQLPGEWQREHCYSKFRLFSLRWAAAPAGAGETSCFLRGFRSELVSASAQALPKIFDGSRRCCVCCEKGVQLLKD